MRYSTFIFDLDGTLSNPLPGMTASINHAFEREGFDPYPSEALATYVGPPLENTFKTLTGKDDDALVLLLIQHYREHYLDTGYRMNTLYDGIVDVLDALSDQRIPVGVCTSKPEKTARQILDYFELETRFEFVSGGDVGVRKADQLSTLLSGGLIDGAALMIGDRAVDIESAQENRLASAAVHWGFGAFDELQCAIPTHHIKTPGVLTELTRLAG